MRDRADEPPAWLGISVLNWNNSPDTIRCLDGLEAAGAFAHANVVVVDNGSSDGSAERLSGWLADRPQLRSACQLVCLEWNEGYGAGNNVAIRLLAQCSPDWIWVMNNDAWVSPENFDRLVYTLRDQSSGWDVLGVRLHEPQGAESDDIVGGGVVATLGARSRPVRVSSQPDGWDRNPVVSPALDFIHGSNLLVRPGVLRSCGLLPEDHFLFWEEVDFSRRALDAGYQLGVASTVVVEHAEGTTSGVRDRSNKTRLAHYYAARSTILYARKHRPRTVAPALTIRASYAFVVAIRQRDPRVGTAVIRGLWDGSTARLKRPPGLA